MSADDFEGVGVLSAAPTARDLADAIIQDADDDLVGTLVDAKITLGEIRADLAALSGKHGRMLPLGKISELSLKLLALEADMGRLLNGKR